MTLSRHWQLNPDVDFLNHGSFGATPTVVLETQRRLRDALERDPIHFLALERELEPKLDHVRKVVSQLVGAPERDLVFVRNTTDGVNAVLRSFSWKSGDEIVITNHGYNACSNAARYVCDRAGATARVAEIPFPIENAAQVLSAIEAQLSERTRMLLVDHVTSPTGLVFPVADIIEMAHQRGIRVIIDGAHAPGMLRVDIGSLDPDYYTGNHHKWLCAPKASGFLYVRSEYQQEVRPTIISHGYNRPRPGRSQFMTEFDWIGTYDPTPLLSVPSAIQFLETLFDGGMSELMSRNGKLALSSQQMLCNALDIEPPAPAEMIGSLVSVPLPPGDHSSLAETLYNWERIEVPIFAAPDPESTLLRVSLQAYNDLGQIERLADSLMRVLSP